MALSGNTHSFEGFANTLPADEDVSLLLLPLATGVDEEEAVLGRETMAGRAGIAIFAFGGPVGIVGRALRDEEDAVEFDGRAARLGFIEAFNGRGSATDMPSQVRLQMVSAGGEGWRSS